jgi:uncharacterized membrane protein (DUF373 family)
MVIVILFGIIDTVYVIFEKITEPPFMLLTINDMLETFGAFLAVLIAIEISRKVIVFDYKHLPAEYVSASGLVLVALGVIYRLIRKKEKRSAANQCRRLLIVGHTQLHNRLKHPVLCANKVG